MIPAPSHTTDTAVPHFALARAPKSPVGEFASLLAEFAGNGGPMEEALQDAPETPQDAAPQDGRKTPARNGMATENAQSLAQSSELSVETSDGAEPILPTKPAPTDPPLSRNERIAARLATAARTGQANARQQGEATAVPLTPGEEEAPRHAAPAHSHPRTAIGDPTSAPIPAISGEPALASATEAADGLPTQPSHQTILAPMALPEAAATFVKAKAPGTKSEGQPRATSRPTLPGQPLLTADAAPQALGDPNDPPDMRNWQGAERLDLRAAKIAARGEGQLPEVKSLGAVTVTKRETHFAPVRQPAAIEEHHWRRQLPPAPAPKTSTTEPAAPRPTFSTVAEQLTHALDSTRGEAEAKLQQATQQAAPGARPLTPVKIVELSLQPASLGTLAITMRLTGTGLRVTVAATSRETAELLREDREALSGLIEGAGYDASEIIVTHRPPPRPISA